MAQYDYYPRYGLENYSFVLPMEKKFDSVASTLWMQENWHHSIALSTFYIISLYAGQKIMESRKPFYLEGPLFYWNMFLAVFSLSGVVRMTPEMFWSVGSNSFEYSICTASFAQGVTGFWTEMFAMSKVFEFVDTWFIVLRKKPLIFLHWYHHVTVLVYTWHAYKDHTASGRWFIWMNYGVHALMYSYYALRAAQFRVPRLIAMTVTVLQIAQMVMGVYIGYRVFNIKSAGQSCQQTNENLYFSFLIYFSYFCLFCHFFYKAYLRPNNRYAKKVGQNGDVKQGNGALNKEHGEDKANNGVLKAQNGTKKFQNGTTKLQNGSITQNGTKGLNTILNDQHEPLGQNGIHQNGTIKNQKPNRRRVAKIE
ncbi:unnamed protein product [Bursaphelenchus okinawaensis]|uniref:Elongation of very long chain fatty acids protein n=1 Tax=Bursaphelenchus okinawaensis TaxID=465554 RepID=A0A811L048_9BILA|nr:unnamed protein product [Bursaphelenchus okinawaensis]CAG9114319.1 unnamed protein product [Bursaphelenchus okinawaensis]